MADQNAIVFRTGGQYRGIRQTREGHGFYSLHDVGFHKPHPASLLAALCQSDVTPAEALFVGELPAIDGVTAERTGVPCAVIGHAAVLGRAYTALPAISDVPAHLHSTF